MHGEVYVELVSADVNGTPIWEDTLVGARSIAHVRTGRRGDMVLCDFGDDVIAATGEISMTDDGFKITTMNSIYTFRTLKFSTYYQEG